MMCSARDGCENVTRMVTSESNTYTVGIHVTSDLFPHLYAFTN